MPPHFFQTDRQEVLFAAQPRQAGNEFQRQNHPSRQTRDQKLTDFSSGIFLSMKYKHVFPIPKAQFQRYFW